MRQYNRQDVYHLKQDINIAGMVSLTQCEQNRQKVYHVKQDVSTYCYNRWVNSRHYISIVRINGLIQNNISVLLEHMH